jgi:hypothetical protein
MLGDEMDAPQYPAGSFVAEEHIDDARRAELIDVIEAAPRVLREMVAGLTEPQLDTKYKNWTIRQIIHHLPDSHVNCYIRFKLALTEDTPTIKAYHEGLWAALEDSIHGDIAAPLALLEGLHRRWVQLLRSMTPAQFSRSFNHPESGEKVPLSLALQSYAWHCRHHTGQIAWLRKNKGF